jgi:CHASE1-domain containing sensor protein
MKIVFASVLLMLTISGFAQENSKGNKAQKFETAKAKMIGHLDSRIKMLQEAKACASSASDRESLKKCRKDMRDKRKSLSKNRREEYKSFRQKRKNRRANKDQE